MNDRIMSRRRFLGLAGLGGAAAVLSACSPSVKWNDPSSSSPGPGTTDGPVTSTTSSSPSGASVHIRLYQGDGSTWGIGVPIIAYLSAKITDGKAMAAATSVTVNGSPAQGAWFFQNSNIYPDYPLEAHYRLPEYWPAHSDVHMELATLGLSGGDGFVFDDSLTLDMSIGKANISKIDGRTKRMIVTSDGQQVFDFPVSLGKASTPTYSGIKVCFDKENPRVMKSDPGEVPAWGPLKVPYSVRVTNSGEFIHSASWNGGNIGTHNTSHGCTNLTLSDAKKFYDFVQFGDPAEYTNTGGSVMPSWDGWGDWNLPWATWQTGGLVPTV